MKKVQLMVAIAAEVPDDCDIEKLFLSIPLECIYIKHSPGNRLLDHCRVTGYETIDVDDSEE